MNCQQVRNRILAVHDPRRLPESLAVHVRDCPGCRQWLTQAVAVERALTHLPVPESDGAMLMATLEQIRTLPAPVEQNAPVLELPVIDRTMPPAVSPVAEPVVKRPGQSLGRWALQLWPAGLVAATLLIGAIAWFSVRGNRPAPSPSSPADPLLDHLVQLNVEMAKTQTPAQRVVVLARVADELNLEMREIARADASGDNMQALRQLYQNVVIGLLDQAPLIDRAQKEAVLGKVAAGLVQAGQRAEQTASESPEHSAAALREAAGTAREGNKKLQRLIREALS